MSRQIGLELGSVALENLRPRFVPQEDLERFILELHNRASDLVEMLLGEV